MENPPLTIEGLRAAFKTLERMSSAEGERVALQGPMQVCHPTAKSGVICKKCGREMMVVVAGNVEYACRCGHTYTRESTLRAIAEECGLI